jgi:hypothetical protein
MTKPWPRYSFRAEASAEVIGYLARLLRAEFKFRVDRWLTNDHGECSVAISSPEHREHLLAIMKDVPDSHVMRETFDWGTK